MKYNLATFGGGCFWCIEAAFLQVKGVAQVQSGYMGGSEKTATYAQISQGNTEHAEVVQVLFDPNLISYAQLMQLFFALHDPTQLNRQGNDIGAQYRSVIFYHCAKQQTQAHQYITEIQTQLANPVVTQVCAAMPFYVAEAEHQNYYQQHPEQGYCSMLIAPKLAAFRAQFSSLLKGANNV